MTMKMKMLYLAAGVRQKPFKIIVQLWRHCVTVTRLGWVFLRRKLPVAPYCISASLTQAHGVFVWCTPVVQPGQVHLWSLITCAVRSLPHSSTPTRSQTAGSSPRPAQIELFAESSARLYVSVTGRAPCLLPTWAASVYRSDWIRSLA